MRITKDKLAIYSKLEREIKMWKEELVKLEMKSLTPASELKQAPGGSGISDPTSMQGMKTAKIKAKIKELLEKLEAERLDIQEGINEIADTEIRAIIYYRYIRGHSWSYTARCIGEGYTGDKLRMQLNRYLAR